jgi:hypothetical protein
MEPNLENAISDAVATDDALELGVVFVKAFGRLEAKNLLASRTEKN